eukprot:1652852-Prymnesium_polylepis.1
MVASFAGAFVEPSWAALARRAFPGAPSTNAPTNALDERASTPEAPRLRSAIQMSVPPLAPTDPEAACCQDVQSTCTAHTTHP